MPFVCVVFVKNVSRVCVFSGKLRQVIHRCLRQSKQVLALPSGSVANLVPVVVDSLVRQLWFEFEMWLELVQLLLFNINRKRF